MKEFFSITFDRIGFKFEQSPMGAHVVVEWEGQKIIGKVWSASYTPERGYYQIGIRSRPSKNTPDEIDQEIDQMRRRKLIWQQ